ncbi:hypothetical protein MM213_14885 [Belliella sp. R4-6]|uniref:Tetratricopeptide repeat-containing protein n=1 Tax=Belliella alkalica TaxID=1730871 RepID=A0ABS9VEA9_9BACT|nr:hypothetical protein [Belliella alkalica]MCH7414784.1 hypothetical protein [Belliella alkalica]
MKKIFLFALLFAFSHLSGATPPKAPVSFCAGGWGEDYFYYNLFLQETMGETQYEPFLLTYETAFYSRNEKQNPSEITLLNENIEEWQKHLDIPYESAHYLVFKSSREDINSLLQGKTISTSLLDFIDEPFIRKHKQALRYIAYAKYLEPYMAVKSTGYNYWGNGPEKNVTELDYQTVINVLERSWQAETDKDLKLRYGYQLVRFAHYNLRFAEALAYFDTHIESLNHRPIMYYYALDQKGGAERGLGNHVQALNDFFQFFTHTKNKKTQAYSSMRITSDLDFEKLLNSAKSIQEKNDLYLLLGYKDFNNPLAAFDKIILNDPNAPQAKVLMARAINQLERSFFPTEYYCQYDKPNCLESASDLRIPLTTNPRSKTFLDQTLEASLKQTKSKDIEDTDFWHLTSAWIYFIQKNSDASKAQLDLVKQAKYKTQKNKLEMLLHITEQPVISSDFEEVLVNRYNIFPNPQGNERESYSPSTNDFIIDVLANRYLLQKDYAKAFLLQNSILSLEYNPDLEHIEAIEEFYHKEEKNVLEQYLMSSITPKHYDYDTRKYVLDKSFDLPVYIAFVKGNTLLREGKARDAKEQFDLVPEDYARFKGDFNPTTQQFDLLHKAFYDGYSNVPASIFGYNRIECFECPEDLMIGEADKVIEVDYLENFHFIKPLMNKRELAEAVISLEKEARKKGKKAAQANYLLGNFYYNTTTIGYYRHILAFDASNGNGSKYSNYLSWGGQYIAQEPTYPLYFKNYGFKAWFPDNFNLPLEYLDKALKLAKEDELKAQILFAAAKCEQGIFYSTQEDEDLNSLKSLSYQDRQNKRVEIKNTRYREYFNKLKSYNHTAFYEDVKTYCKYFEFYTTSN